jgi:hypothetical protein
MGLKIEIFLADGNHFLPKLSRTAPLAFAVCLQEIAFNLSPYVGIF